VQFKNSILIFDESHNLEAFASDSASFDLTGLDIGGCINEVARAVGYLQSMPELAGSDGGSSASGVKMDNLIRLKSIFLQMEDFLENQLPSGSFAGEYIFEVFAKGANLNYSNHAIFLSFVKQVSDMIMEIRGAGASSGTPKLDHFVGCIKRVFGTPTEGQSVAKAKAYRVHITGKPRSSSRPTDNVGNGGFVGLRSSSNSGRVLSYWCFAPSLAMHELAGLNVRSIIVTSGTLSPLSSYSLELGIPFPNSLENPHIISNKQILVHVVGKGVSGKELSSNYERRDDVEYIKELGNTIISLVRVIPGGVLIFFPSYGVMENCVEKWGGPMSSRTLQSNSYKNRNSSTFFEARKKHNSMSEGRPRHGRYSFPIALDSHSDWEPGSSISTPWRRLLSIKSIVLEPKATSELNDAIAEYEKFIFMPKTPGCIMMGVCRGMYHANHRVALYFISL